ncbi:MAG: TIGR00730 family Rossman fold protein [Planctomycetota bacterium]
MSSSLRRVCVYCGSRTGEDPAFADAARRLGSEIARRGLELVYGGASVGLMGIVADAVLAGGGAVRGVIPTNLFVKEVAHFGITELIEVSSMHERKARMAELADAFVALPGGFGTLEEIFEALTWTQIGIHRKPCALLDVSGYFAPLLDFLDGTVRAGFVSPRNREHLIAESDPSRLLDLLSTSRSGPDLAVGWSRLRSDGMGG